MGLHEALCGFFVALSIFVFQELWRSSSLDRENGVGGTGTRGAEFGPRAIGGRCVVHPIPWSDDSEAFPDGFEGIDRAIQVLPPVGGGDLRPDPRLPFGYHRE